MVTLKENAATLHRRMKKVAERDGLSVYAVVLEEEIRHDSPLFNDLTKEAFPLAILLRVQAWGTGPVEIRVNRSNDSVGHVGQACQKAFEAKKDTRYKGGGGHPFAAGLQVDRSEYNMIDIEAIGEDLLDAMQPVSLDKAAAEKAAADKAAEEKAGSECSIT